MTHTLEVLYVEDCEATVALFRLSLKRYCPNADIVLDVADTVSEAIERFTTERHVAALIDLNLPDGDGIEVAAHIRQLHKTLPIIFLSATITDQNRLVTEQYNPMGCLAKDHSKQFVDRITRYISTAVR